MQLMHSGNGMGQEINSEEFAALRGVALQASSAIPMAPKRGGVFAAGTEIDVLGEIAEGAGLAHDARNLLGALSLYSDLLAMPGVLHEEHRGYAAELRMLSDRSWAMIDRLVSHTRTERNLTPIPESTVLPEVVDRCRGLLSRVAGRAVEIVYGPGAFEPVNVPVESVERILTNLVKNAAEATPGSSPITIHVEGVMPVEGDQSCRVVLTVIDHGCGMDAATVRRLMRDGVSKANGRGLGFRVVRELVANSGGCLKVESRQQSGTRILATWHGVTAAETRAESDEMDAQSKLWPAEREGGMAC